LVSYLVGIVVLLHGSSGLG